MYGTLENHQDFDAFFFLSCNFSRFTCERMELPEPNQQGKVKKRLKRKERASFAVVDPSMVNTESRHLPQLSSPANVPFVTLDGVSIQRQHLRVRFPFFRETTKPGGQSNLFASATVATTQQPNVGKHVAELYEATHQKQCQMCNSTAVDLWARMWQKLLQVESEKRVSVTKEEAEIREAFADLFLDETRTQFSRQLADLAARNEFLVLCAEGLKSVQCEEHEQRMHSERIFLKTLRALARASQRIDKEMQAAKHTADARTTELKEEEERRERQQTDYLAALDRLFTQKISRLMYDEYLSREREFVRLEAKERYKLETTLRNLITSQAVNSRLRAQEQFSRSFARLWDEYSKSAARLADDDERIARTTIRLQMEKEQPHANRATVRRMLHELQEQERQIRNVRQHFMLLEAVEIGKDLTEQRCAEAPLVCLHEERSKSVATSSSEEFIPAPSALVPLELQFVEFIELQHREKIASLVGPSLLFLHTLLNSFSGLAALGPETMMIYWRNYFEQFLHEAEELQPPTEEFVKHKLVLVLTGEGELPEQAFAPPPTASLVSTPISDSRASSSLVYQRRPKTVGNLPGIFHPLTQGEGEFVLVPSPTRPMTSTFGQM